MDVAAELGRRHVKNFAGAARALRTHPAGGSLSSVDGAAGERSLPHLAVTATLEGDRVRLTVNGELDVSTCQLLTDVGVAATNIRQCRAVELDLGAVTFADCRGLGALVALRRDAAAHERAFQISRCPRAITRLLILTRLDDMLEPAR